MLNHPCYRLAGHVFRPMAPFIGLICALVLALTLILPLTLFPSYNSANGFFPYEQLLELAGVPIVFLGGLVAAAGTAAAIAGRDRKNGLSILMALPMPRRNVFLAYALASVAAVALVWGSALFAVCAAYLPTMHSADAAARLYTEQVLKQTYTLCMLRNNGLFLAFHRGAFLRLLLPLGALECVLSYTSLLLLGVLPAYGVFGGQTKGGPVLAALVAGGVVILLYAQANLFFFRYDSFTTRVWVLAGVAVALLGWFLTAGIRHRNQDAGL